MQVTATSLTSCTATVVGWLTIQVWAGAVGCIATVTWKELPAATLLWKVKAPFALTVRSSPPLSRRTRPDPLSPATVPPITTMLAAPPFPPEPAFPEPALPEPALPACPPVPAPPSFPLRDIPPSLPPLDEPCPPPPQSAPTSAMPRNNARRALLISRSVNDRAQMRGPPCHRPRQIVS